MAHPINRGDSFFYYYLCCMDTHGLLLLAQVVLPADICTRGKNVEKITKSKKAKHPINKSLAFFVVPRPGTDHLKHKKTKEYNILIIKYMTISHY